MADLKSTSSAMACQEISFGYETGRAVIKDFTADLASERFHVLIGPNAAGKSTLMRVLLGQLRPWTGNVQIQGTDVIGMEASKRAARISYVPQRGGVNFAFTVEQVVAFGRHALVRDLEAVERAIAVCNLTQLRHRIYARLSAGQQQRVLLARAVAQSAGGGIVMLLDEPVSAMDLQHIHQSMRMLADLTREGLAVLVALHDLNLASRYADVVWLLNEGRLAASGPWDQVLRPDRLEPIYGVDLTAMPQADNGRPVFAVNTEGSKSCVARRGKTTAGT